MLYSSSTGAETVARAYSSRLTLLRAVIGDVADVKVRWHGGRLSPGVRGRRQFDKVHSTQFMYERVTSVLAFSMRMYDQTCLPILFGSRSANRQTA